MAYRSIEDRRASSSLHYEANKAAYKARAMAHNKKTRAAVRAFLLEHLLGHPCVDCRESDPVVLEFDHRDPKEKCFDLGSSVTGGYALESVKLEVAKCDIRCANCHRRKTYRELGRTNRTARVAK